MFVDFRIAVVPHKETHLAEETLRACYADFGNKFEVSPKWYNESKIYVKNRKYKFISR